MESKGDGVLYCTNNSAGPGNVDQGPRLIFGMDIDIAEVGRLHVELLALCILKIRV